MSDFGVDQKVREAVLRRGHLDWGVLTIGVLLGKSLGRKTILGKGSSWSIVAETEAGMV